MSSTYGTRHLVCYTCIKILPRSRFTDKSRVTPYALNGSKAHKRFCVQCGLKNERFQHGQTIMIDMRAYNIERSGSGAMMKKRVNALEWKLDRAMSYDPKGSFTDDANNHKGALDDFYPEADYGLYSSD
ncbi:MAG: hypothetical protein Q9218_008351 [Villophora microphyllina]